MNLIGRKLDRKLQDSVDELGDTFQELRDKSVKSLNTLTTSVEELTNKSGRSLDTLTDTLRAAKTLTDKSAQSLDTLTDAVEVLTDTFRMLIRTIRAVLYISVSIFAVIGVWKIISYIN